MSTACEAQPRDIHTATDTSVARVTHVCREHVAIEMTATSFPPSAPGQFLQLRCRAEDAIADRVVDWPEGAFPPVSNPEFTNPQPFTRRPFSIADRWIDQHGITHLVIISRAIGIGTRWLDHLREGDTLNVTGPLGHGFELPTSPDTPLILIGGGVGIPPLIYLSRILRERGCVDVTLILGVRSHDLLPLELLSAPPADGAPSPSVRLPIDPPYPAVIATDDGSLGLHGFVTDALRNLTARRAPDAATPTIMACGPEPMLKSIAAATRAARMPAQLCIERNMGCGLGTCLSCVVRMRDPAKPMGWRWALACTDGPVFDRDALPDYD